MAQKKQTQTKDKPADSAAPNMESLLKEADFNAPTVPDEDRIADDEDLRSASPRPGIPLDLNELLQNDVLLNRAYKIASIMASATVTVPEHLRGNLGNCFAITLQALSWRMSPFMVAQKTHVINGQLGYEAQLVHAVLHSVGPLSTRMSHEYLGNWEQVRGKHRIERSGNGKPIPRATYTVEDEKGLGVTITAWLVGESESRSHTVWLSDCHTRNSTLWAAKPHIQIYYQCIKEWARMHCPEVMQGIVTTDELRESWEPADVASPRRERTVRSEEQKTDDQRPGAQTASQNLRARRQRGRP